MLHLQEATHQEGPLQYECGDQHVEANAAVAIAFEERHQEAKPDEDHDVYILEHWNGGKSLFKGRRQKEVAAAHHQQRRSQVSLAGGG